MAYFAEIDADGIVQRVIAVPDEQERRGGDFCAKDLGLGGTWIQTSINGRIRRRFAAIGYIYRADRDAFILPQPYPSWSLNAVDDWEAPVARPDDEKEYEWNEDRQRWDKVQGGR